MDKQKRGARAPGCAALLRRLRPSQGTLVGLDMLRRLCQGEGLDQDLGRLPPATRADVRRQLQRVGQQLIVLQCALERVA